MTTVPQTPDSRSRIRLTPGTTALLQLALGAALISFSPVLVNVAHVGPTVSGFYRLLFGGLALALIVLVGPGGVTWRWPPWPASSSPRTWRYGTAASC
jgi:hypothetical protein